MIAALSGYSACSSPPGLRLLIDGALVDPVSVSAQYQYDKCIPAITCEWNVLFTNPKYSTRELRVESLNGVQIVNVPREIGLGLLSAHLTQVIIGSARAGAEVSMFPGDADSPAELTAVDTGSFLHFSPEAAVVRLHLLKAPLVSIIGPLVSRVPAGREDSLAYLPSLNASRPIGDLDTLFQWKVLCPPPARGPFDQDGSLLSPSPNGIGLAIMNVSNVSRSALTQTA